MGSMMNISKRRAITTPATKNDMDISKAVGIVDGYEKPESVDEYHEAWQTLVDSGLALQRSEYRSQALALIEQGKIKLGEYRGLFDEEEKRAA